MLEHCEELGRHSGATLEWSKHVLENGHGLALLERVDLFPSDDSHLTKEKRITCNNQTNVLLRKATNVPHDFLADGELDAVNLESLHEPGLEHRHLPHELLRLASGSDDRDSKGQCAFGTSVLIEVLHVEEAESVALLVQGRIAQVVLGCQAFDSELWSFHGASKRAWQDLFQYVILSDDLLLDNSIRYFDTLVEGNCLLRADVAGLVQRVRDEVVVEEHVS